MDSVTLEAAPTLYRPCVAIMLVNLDGKVFVGQRIDNPGSDAWQMPQGGIERGEDPQDAALRELEEETGISPDHVTFLGALDEPLSYDLPEDLQGKLWGGKYRGQSQEWFLMRFHGDDSDINIGRGPHAEFSAWQWLDPEELPDRIVPFKKRVYRIVLEKFRDLI